MGCIGKHGVIGSHDGELQAGAAATNAKTVSLPDGRADTGHLGHQRIDLGGNFSLAEVPFIPWRQCKGHEAAGAEAGKDEERAHFATGNEGLQQRFHTRHLRPHIIEADRVGRRNAQGQLRTIFRGRDFLPKIAKDKIGRTGEQKCNQHDHEWVGEGNPQGEAVKDRHGATKSADRPAMVMGGVLLEKARCNHRPHRQGNNR